MANTLPEMLQRLEFEEAAGDYLRWLRKEHPEHFMESPAQAQQRKITVVAFDLLAPHIPGFHGYNELLVQTRRKKDSSLVQVVPDNMVVLTEQPLRIGLSYNVPIQPVGPFWVLEYVSQNNPRKDYQKSLPKYEKDLKVPYCLIFHPDEQELMLFRHNKRRYVSVKPDHQERYAIDELELELGIVDGWVRYWFRGQFLGLPADLQRELDEVRHDNQQMRQRAARLAELALKLQKGALSPAELQEFQLLAAAALAPSS